jgi:hypothetical protein
LASLVVADGVSLVVDYRGGVDMKSAEQVLARCKARYIPRGQGLRRYNRKADYKKREMAFLVSTIEDGYRQLATDVLVKAIKEWRKVKDAPCQEREKWALKSSLLEFFMSDTFEIYCDSAHINPDAVLEKLKIDWKFIRMEPVCT